MNDPDITFLPRAHLAMMEAPYHSAATFQMRDILSRHIKSLGLPKTMIASNLLVLFDLAGTSTRVVPDIFVALGEFEHPESSFRVPKGGNLRMFVLEVLSPSTYQIDQTTKMLSYAKMGAQEYWLFDPTGELQDARLQGFRLADGKYLPIPGSGDCREHAIHSGVLCADLYLEGQELRLENPALTEEVPTLSELEELWKEMRDRRHGEKGDSASAERYPLDASGI